MFVGKNKKMVEGWNKISKKRYFGVVSQLERCPVIWKRHPNPHVLWENEFSSEVTEKTVDFRKIISL